MSDLVGGIHFVSTWTPGPLWFLSNVEVPIPLAGVLFVVGVAGWPPAYDLLLSNDRIQDHLSCVSCLCHQQVTFCATRSAAIHALGVKDDDLKCMY